jgi:iron complex transport system ATP-binding protein
VRDICGNRLARSILQHRWCDHRAESYNGSTVALDDVTVRVPAGCLTMIVGPPGDGKTVLMKSLSCELQWASDSILIQAVPARLWPSKKRDACLCTCPAAISLPCPSDNPAACSLLQNDGNGGLMYVDSGFRDALRLLGIEHLEKRCGPTLDARDRRRVDLAFTLAPLLSGMEARRIHLWLDDPLDGIDSLHQHRLLQWLKETTGTRQTTVVTATDHALVPVHADHSILLAGGTLIAEGPPKTASAQTISLERSAIIRKPAVIEVNRLGTWLTPNPLICRAK